jgi:polyhydroxyalkanoate synthase
VPAPSSIQQAARAGLDVLLAEAVVDQGASSRFLRPTAAAGVVAGLARRPARPLRRIGGLGIELGRVAADRSERRPAKADRRFADPAWEGNWLLRRLMGT